MKQFIPPVYFERPDTGVRLMDAFIKIARGTSVLKQSNGLYIQETYPSQDDVAAASVAYIGGHTYIVSDTEGAALTAAGYTVTNYVPPVERTDGTVNPANSTPPPTGLVDTYSNDYQSLYGASGASAFAPGTYPITYEGAY